MGKNSLNEEERADPRRSISQTQTQADRAGLRLEQTDRPLRQVKLRGLERVDWFYRLAIVALQPGADAEADSDSGAGRLGEKCLCRPPKRPAEAKTRTVNPWHGSPATSKNPAWGRSGLGNKSFSATCKVVPFQIVDLFGGPQELHGQPESR